MVSYNGKGPRADYYLVVRERMMGVRQTAVLHTRTLFADTRCKGSMKGGCFARTSSPDGEEGMRVVRPHRIGAAPSDDFDHCCDTVRREMKSGVVSFFSHHFRPYRGVKIDIFSNTGACKSSIHLSNTSNTRSLRIFLTFSE